MADEEFVDYEEPTIQRIVRPPARGPEVTLEYLTETPDYEAFLIIDGRRFKITGMNPARMTLSLRLVE